MKSTLVRAAVLSLALVGFGAASIVNKAEAASAKHATTLAGTIPMPTCGPNNGCGMD
jgi:hypothetical protein